MYYKRIYTKYCGKCSTLQEMNEKVLIVDFGKQLESVADGCEYFSKACAESLGFMLN